MYAVHVMYPRTDGSEFNEQWWLDVHSPMGIGLLLKRCGVRPIESMYTRQTIGMDRSGSSSDYHIISTLIMETKQEAEAFIDLFEMTEESDMLSADWDNYTNAPPVAVIGEWVKQDIAETLTRSDDVIERASKQMKAARSGS